MMTAIDGLGKMAAEIAMRSAAAYLHQHDLDADIGELGESLIAKCKAALPEALDDAKEAIDMGGNAEATFRASMSQAGIEAAKECGFAKGAAK